MKRRFRLTRSTDIQRVRRLGKSYAHPLMVLLVVGNEQTESRFGIVAGRTVGGAVQRNRAKRLLRAALQPRLLGIKPGWDVVLLARHGMSATTFTQTQSALEALLRRAGITNESLNVLRS